MGHWRPKTREDCEQGARPCPYFGCKYHLAMEVVGSSLKHVGERDREREPGRQLSQRASPRRFDTWSDAIIRAQGAMPETCALDVAEEGATQQEVAEILNLSTERVSQIEKDGLRKLRLWKECA